MSRRNKLFKFAEILTYPNVFENPDFHNPHLLGLNGEPVEMKGKWDEAFFRNGNPIILELACGRGEYSFALGKSFPNKNFIGVDIKGARIYQGATKVLDAALTNVAFLRTKIELIDHFFEAGEISEIWITFPDPFLRDSKANKRLTSPRFLKLYKHILKPDGLIHLKTDDPKLYDFTLEVLNEDSTIEVLYNDDDIYSKPLPEEALEIKTYYEIKHLAIGRTIKYVKFKFKQ